MGEAFVYRSHAKSPIVWGWVGLHGSDEPLGSPPAELQSNLLHSPCGFWAAKCSTHTCCYGSYKTNVIPDG